MRADVSRPLIFVVISVLVVALIFSSFTPFIVFSLPPQSTTSPKNCIVRPDGLSNNCCWLVPFLNSYLTFCQGCRKTETGFNDCDPVYRKSGPAPPLKGGGVLEQPPIQGIAPQGVLPQDGVLQQPPSADQGATELPPPPATEETQPATEQSVPVCQDGLEFNEDLGFCVPTECPEGQELNEETGICVLEEQPAAAEEPEEQPTEEPTTEEEQPSEESGSEDGNSDNN